jgi:hypothetical protein
MKRRVVRLADLTPAQRRLVLALLAARASISAVTDEPKAA